MMYSDNEKIWGRREEVTATNEDEDQQTLIQSRGRKPKPASWFQGNSFISGATYGLLILVIVMQTFVIVRWRTELSERPPRISKLDPSLLKARNIPRSSGLLNRFWRGDNLTEANDSWRNINSGHGIIKMDPEFARSQGFPDTMRHPHDQSNLVYALEAYHMIHCIQVLRKDFLLIRDGKEPTKPLEHAMHCFDALRQSVMCQASDELLIITGHGHKNGFNQTRECRSWDDLRDYATRNTACYWDDELPDEAQSRWNMCDDGTDGLPVGNLLD